MHTDSPTSSNGPHAPNVQIPAKMLAIEISAPGGPEVLKPTTVETPTPGPAEVLIKVAASGVNRPDIMQRSGLYPAPSGHSPIPGLEVAGTVVAIGSGATGISVGTPVMALVNGGGYAEFCRANSALCIPVPDTLSMKEAAGIPETFLTVWHNVFQRGQLSSGDWFLVHGGTSGIGVTAIQVAKAFGANVIATAGSQEKCDACTALGADVAINYRTQNYVDVVKEKTARRGVNVILDMVGGDYIEKNIKCLADDGRLVNIAYQNGSKASIDFLRVMLKRLTITGSTLRIRTDAVKAEIARNVREKVIPLVSNGTIKIPIDSTFDLKDAARAHAHMDEGNHVGKIILTV